MNIDLLINQLVNFQLLADEFVLEHGHDETAWFLVDQAEDGHVVGGCEIFTIIISIVHPL